MQTGLARVKKNFSLRGRWSRIGTESIQGTRIKQVVLRGVGGENKKANVNVKKKIFLKGREVVSRKN